MYLIDFKFSITFKVFCSSVCVCFAQDVCVCVLRRTCVCVFEGSCLTALSRYDVIAISCAGDDI